MRANQVSPARQDIAEYVMSHDGVGRPENYADGDEEDVVLYDLLVTAGPKGLPVDLTLGHSSSSVIHVTVQCNTHCRCETSFTIPWRLSSREP